MNNPALVMDLLENNKYLTIMLDNPKTSKEYKITFEMTDEEAFLYDITVEKLAKNTKRINIPLDFEEVEGFDDLLQLIAAFTYPRDNIIFKVYRMTDLGFESEYHIARDAKKPSQ